MNEPGTIGWHDLTIENAEQVSDFYQAVIGWEKEVFDMGNYKDFVMINGDDDEAAAGICHSKGGNADLPPQWLMYVNVANLDESIAACLKNGGKVIGEKRKMGEDGRKYALIQDPAGAHMMICG
jgi:predicted enzyme related to lactoylglutathione lyase